MAKLGAEPIYREAPNEVFFVASRPEEGFRLIEAGERAPFDKMAAFRLSGFGVRGAIRNRLLTVFSRDAEAEQRGFLLLPQGEPVREWLSMFLREEKDRALFDAFRRLGGAEEIRSFASKFGNLRSRGQGCDFDLKNDFAFLESVALWEREIADVNKAVALWEEWRKSEKPETQESLLLLLNSKQLAYSLTQPYRADKRGSINSFFIPESLGGVLWLILGQSIFRDGPKELIAERCYLTGGYYSLSSLSKRTTGEHKGLYYLPGEMHKKNQQQYYRRKKQNEGKTVKKGRKGKTEFSV